jgi:hypothetical protein
MSPKAQFVALVQARLLSYHTTGEVNGEWAFGVVARACRIPETIFEKQSVDLNLGTWAREFVMYEAARCQEAAYAVFKPQPPHWIPRDLYE